MAENLMALTEEQVIADYTCPRCNVRPGSRWWHTGARYEAMTSTHVARWKAAERDRRREDME
jgi:hypothetical protein